MRRIEPSATATWLLNHFTPGGGNEALAGDLQEEFQNGRTTGWYWLQVVIAIALGWIKQAIAYPGVLIFAALWSVAAPSWLVYTDKIQNSATTLNGLLSKLDFPWSMLGYFGWSLCVWLAFIWMGVALHFLGSWASSNSSRLPLGRMLLLSGSVYVCVFLSMSGVTLMLPSGSGIDRRTLTALTAITDLRMYAIEARFVTLLTLLVTLWAAIPKPGNRRRTA